ncbi:lytic transglycosylase domain-containing protein [Paracoccaceae bacterium Fryx2]|nr:lytic transglycosylase domain-containing protein [Paracoccaceae bacterium Fryx2]
MPALDRRAALALMLCGLAACGRPSRDGGMGRGDLYPNETPELRRLIQHHANAHDVPVDLVQRVVLRESSHNPGARNGPYYGLMQILPQTAQTMGYRGPAQGLLDADTNLKYGVKYLRGAWLVANGNRDRAVMWYSKGYYYEAKRRGMLVETGLRSG